MSQRFESYVPRFIIDGRLVWGWVPYNKFNPIHWIAKRRPYRL